MKGNSYNMWVEFFSEAIDEKINQIRADNELILDECRKLVAANLLENSGIVELGKQHDDLDGRIDDLEKRLEVLKQKRALIGADIGEHISGIRYWTGPLYKRIANSNSGLVDKMFESTPQGAEAARLRDFRKNMKMKVAIASTKAELLEVVQSIANDLGIDLNDLEG